MNATLSPTLPLVNEEERRAIARFFPGAKTVKDILDYGAQKSQLLGNSGILKNAVYSIGSDDKANPFHGYLLRVNKHQMQYGAINWADDVKRTTSLHPVKLALEPAQYVFQHGNIGSPLLVSDALPESMNNEARLSIVRRQHGKALKSFTIEDRAAILQSEPQALRDLFAHAAFLGWCGASHLDCHSGNIIYNEHCHALGFVDINRFKANSDLSQMDRFFRARQAIEELLDRLGDLTEERMGTDLKAIADETRQKLKHFKEAIEQSADKPIDMAADMFDWDEKLKQRAPFAEITEVSAVKMADPPEALLAALRAIDRQSHQQSQAR